jgi:hypothetical protein
MHEVWEYILTSIGINKDPRHAALTFKEPKPCFLQKQDPNQVLKDLKEKRIKKNRHLILMTSDILELENKSKQDEALQASSKGINDHSSMLQKSKSAAAFRLKSNSTIAMTTFSSKKPMIYREKRAEGGLVVNDTLALEEKKSGDNGLDYDTHPIEKKINLKMHKGSNNKNTISFFCKELQQEHQRLVMNPQEVLNCEGVHPFYRFVPEHLEKDKTYEASLNFRKTASLVILRVNRPILFQLRSRD